MDEKQIKKYLEQIQSQTQKTIDDADPFRVEAYRQLERIQMAKQGVLAKKRKRLAADVGEDHPSIHKLDEKITLRTQVIRGVENELQRSATKQPDIDPQDWIFHGNVKNSVGKPLSGVKVAIADKSGKLIKAFGSASTDRRGYFRLIVENIAVILRKLLTEDLRKKLYIYPQILDDANVVLLRSDRALQPRPGQTDFAELIAGKGGGQIVRPPVRPIRPLRPVRPVRPPITRSEREELESPAVDRIAAKAPSTPKPKKAKKKSSKKK